MGEGGEGSKGEGGGCLWHKSTPYQDSSGVEDLKSNVTGLESGLRIFTLSGSHPSGPVRRKYT